MSSSGAFFLATMMVFVFLQKGFVLSSWWPQLDEFSDDEYSETDDTDRRRPNDLLWPSAEAEAAAVHRPLQPSSYHRICTLNFCRKVRNRFQLKACIRRNCRQFSAAATAATTLPGGPAAEETAADSLPVDDRLRMMRRSCPPGTFCGGSEKGNEHADQDEEEKEEVEVVEQEEEDTSPEVVSVSFDGQHPESSSLEAAIWRPAAAAQRRKSTTSCASICRRLAHEVYYGSCIRYLCHSSISSASEDDIEASSNGQPSVTLQANPERHDIWKRYGMRICAEAFCKSHYGYELMACGLSRCHGK